MVKNGKTKRKITSTFTKNSSNFSCSKPIETGALPLVHTACLKYQVCHPKIIFFMRTWYNKARRFHFYLKSRPFSHSRSINRKYFQANISSGKIISSRFTKTKYGTEPHFYLRKLVLCLEDLQGRNDFLLQKNGLFQMIWFFRSVWNEWQLLSISSSSIFCVFYTRNGTWYMPSARYRVLYFQELCLIPCRHV